MKIRLGQIVQLKEEHKKDPQNIWKVQGRLLKLTSTTDRLIQLYCEGIINKEYRDWVHQMLVTKNQDWYGLGRADVEWCCKAEGDEMWYRFDQLRQRETNK